MRLAFVLVVCFAASSALAQADRAPPKVPVQRVDFSTGSSVSGSVEAPVVEFTVLPERPRFKRLIQLRGSFANELHRSVDAMR